MDNSHRHWSREREFQAFVKLCGAEREWVQSKGVEAKGIGNSARTVEWGALTPIVVDAIGLHKSHGDRSAQWVIILLQLCLPEDSIPILAEILLGPMASWKLTRTILLAEHGHSIQAVVADMVAGDMRQAGGHHPNPAALVGCDREENYDYGGKVRQDQADLPVVRAKTSREARPWLATSHHRALAAFPSCMRPSSHRDHPGGKCFELSQLTLLEHKHID